MARAEHRAQIHCPLHAVYAQLLQFEDYPRFMQDVAMVQVVNPRHLRCRSTGDDGPSEWDVEITEQVPERVLGWRSRNGVAGRLVLDAAGESSTTVLCSLEWEEGAAQGDEASVTRRVEQDMARLKKFLESRAQGGQWRGGPAAEPVLPSGSIGSVDGSRQQDSRADAGALRIEPAPASAGPRPSIQSDAGLSAPDEEAGENSPFRVAEEQNLDQQSTQAREAGHMGHTGPGAAAVEKGVVEVIAEAMRPAGSRASGQDEADRTEAAAGVGSSDYANSPFRGSARRQRLQGLLQGWDKPQGWVRRLRTEVDHMLERVTGRTNGWSPALDAVREGQQLRVQIDLPGVRREDVQVEIRERKLIIQGARREDAPSAGHEQLHRECTRGRFYREVLLPEGIRSDSASASLRDGVLRIAVSIESGERPGKKVSVSLD